jgi:methyl-accepting chemotaxis protein
MTTATALKRAAAQAAIAADDASSAANDGKAVVNHAVQSIQKLPTNVEPTHKYDARLTVITATI